MKILTVLGARPQFIKAALLSKELRKNNEEIIVHTGQHYDKEMSDVFFDEMNIPKPDYNLGIGSETHAVQTAHMMMALEKVLISETPEIVLVYGDTNSTLAAALTASKLNIPIAHVEAGPRMFDKTVPEEINRIITDHLSTLLFAPTAKSVENLNREGLFERVYLTGDVMLDNFKYFLKKAGKSSKILQKLNLKNKGYILATIHRSRNTNIEKNLKNIINAFLLLSKEKTIVFPLHPRTGKYLKKYGLYNAIKKSDNICLINPVGYMDMLILTKNAEKVITDSGGLQKEAYFAQVPCITLDDSSAWPETVDDGWNLVVHGTTGEITESVLKFKPDTMQNEVFGHGNSLIEIHKILDAIIK